MANSRELGTFIRARRSEIGLNMTQLAKEANVSRTWLGFVEKGTHASTGKAMGIGFANIRQLAAPLGLDPTRLSDLAGHSKEAKQPFRKPYLYYGESVLARSAFLGVSCTSEGRTEPLIYRDQVLHETDLHASVQEAGIAEVSVLPFLAQLPRATELRVIGVTSNIGADPTSLYTLDGEEADKNVHDMESVGTFGWQTTETLTLLAHLQKNGRSWRMTSLDHEGVLAEMLSEEDPREPLAVEAMYEPGSLVHGLRKGSFDAITLPSHPIVQDSSDYKLLRHARLSELESLHDYPSSLLVTTADKIGKRGLLQVIDRVKYGNEKAYKEIGAAHPGPSSLLAQLGLKETSSGGTLLAPELNTDVMIEEPKKLARELAVLSELAILLGLHGDNSFQPRTLKEIALIVLSKQRLIDAREKMQV